MPNNYSKGRTVFKQHQCYSEAKGDGRLPHTIFYKQLVAQLWVWRRQTEEIILWGDFNEHIYNGRLGPGTRQHLNVQMVLSDNKKTLTSYACHWLQTHWRGIFNTMNSFDKCYNLTKHGGVGDNRYFIIGFNSESVLGGIFPRIVAPSKWNLHCDCERIRNNYNLVLNELANIHQLSRSWMS